MTADDSVDGGEAVARGYRTILGSRRDVRDRELVDAQDPHLGRVVTVHRARSVLDRAGELRFLRGATIAAVLDHPGAPCVLGMGRDGGGRVYFVTPRRRVVAFDRWCRGAAGVAPPLARRLIAMSEVCRVLGHAHRSGVVHGHVGPASVAIGELGEVTVVGWDDAAVSGALASADLANPAGTSAPIDDVHGLQELLVVALGDDREAVPELAELTLGSPSAPIETVDALARRIDRFLDGERDRELRAKVAVRQLSEAREALSQGPRGHGLALARARRALALDPSSAAAAAIVGRLMVEVPSPLPPPAVAVIERGDQRVLRGMSSAVVFAFAVLLAYVGVMLLQGVRDRAVVAGIAVIGSCLLTWAVHWRGWGPQVFSWPAMLGTATLFMLYARVMGPFSSMPALATLATLAVCFFPRRPPGTAVLATFAVPVVGIWLLEVTHVLETTTTVVDGALWIDSPAVRIDGGMTVAGLVFAAVGVVAVAAGIATWLARAHAGDTRRLVIQRWKIRQIAAGATGEVAADPPARS